jgi:hypothetical protein
MAKKTGTILAGAIAMMFCASLFAQQKGNAKAGNKAVKDTTATAKKKALRPVVYLGHSNYSGGPITLQHFDSLMRQGISAKDEKGTAYKIIGFNFNYYERMFFTYEDSAGNPIVQTDISTEYCPGDTVTSNITNSIYTRIKNGDTVYIDRILLEKTIGKDIDTILGKEVKCVLKRSL